MERKLLNVPDSICKVTVHAPVRCGWLWSCTYSVAAENTEQLRINLACTNAVKKFVYMFCKGMVSYTKNVIQVLSLEKANAIAHRFEMEHHIPQIIGGVDGTHIPIVPPKDGYRDFVNRKGWPSYVLQAVVDDQYC